MEMKTTSQTPAPGHERVSAAMFGEHSEMPSTHDSTATWDTFVNPRASVPLLSRERYRTVLSGIPFRIQTSTTPETPDLIAFKMKSEGINRDITRIFLDYYHRITAGADGYMRETDLKPLGEGDLPGYNELNRYELLGRSKLHQTARIILNGGLGTSMGLTTAKSLVPVCDGRTFLDIILSRSREEKVPLCLMNSVRTNDETRMYLDRHAPGIPLPTFLQHRFPKILRESLRPAVWPDDPEREWNPAGHGDVYNALHVSGMLQNLLDQGIRYVFISNSDNLGATLDPALLGYFVKKGLPFMMEVAERTPSDAKGGHLARRRSGGLILRECAQCHPDDRNAFQDIQRHRYFNTNNIWISLPFLKTCIRRHGLFSLPMILNPKPLDPRNPESPGVYQVETAMGAAISIFEGASAVRVPRSRFFPVKTTGDLLLLRSGSLKISPETGVIRATGHNAQSIRISLDPLYYKHLDEFDKRFCKGVPDLQRCDSLTVKGNIYFDRDITIRGNVTISSPDANPRRIPRGTIVDSDLSL